MLFPRLCLLLLAAGLPLVLSTRAFFDPLSPKYSLWLLGGGLLLARPTLPVRFDPLLASLLCLAAVMSIAGGPVSGSLWPWLIGAACYIRVRELCAERGFALKYLRFAAGVAALAGLYAVSQAVWNRMVPGIKFVNPFGSRVLGTLGNPTFLADYLAALLPLSLVFMEGAAGMFSYIFWAASALFISAGIMLSGSKGGQLAAAVSFLAWVALLLGRRKTVRLHRLVVPGVALLALAGLAAVEPGGLARLVSRWTSVSERFSFTQRIHILEGTGRLLAGSPVVGHGPGTFPVLFPSRAPLPLARELGLSLSVNHAHNDYSEIASDLGLVGLVLFILVIARGIRLRPEPGIQTGAVLSVLALAVSMAANFVHFLPSSSFLLWTNAGVAAALVAPSSPAPAPSPAANRTGRLLAVLLGLTAFSSLLSEGLLQKGSALIEAGDGPAATAFLERAVAAAPFNRHAWQHLGRAREISGQPGEAAVAYRRACRLAPNHPITSFNVARAERDAWLASRSRDEGARTRAVDAARRAVRADPYLLDARLWGAEMSLAGRDSPGARGFLFDLPEDLALLPSGFHRARARLLRSEGRSREAARELSLAATSQAAETAARAEEAADGENFAEAETLARKAIELDRGCAHAWDVLGYLMHRRGNMAEARKCYATLATLAPDSLAAQLNLGLLSLAERDPASARRHLNRAAEISPDNADVHLLRARVLAFEGRKRDAAEEYGWILRKDPANQQARAELSALLRR